MKLSTFVAATAVSAMPMMASSAVVPLTGSSTVASVDNIYTFNADSNAAYEHEFFVSIEGNGVAAISMDQLLSAYFSSITVSWNNGESVTGLDAAGKASVSTAFDGTGSDTLVISFDQGTDPNVTYSGSVQITAVPVPAGLLLMGTALAGFGALRRRKG